jgi:hypothetical protein
MIIGLREAVHKNFLEAKRLQHLVFSTRFERAIATASTEQINNLTELVKKGDLLKLKETIDKMLEGDLSSMSIMKLRFIARQYSIKNYYVLTRDQLIGAISNAQEKFTAGPSRECC